MPDNTLAQIAINVTLYHWGIHGWIVYCLVGLLLALMSYRENLPMSMKSCFYPLIGDKIFGWMGDLIDIISVLTTLFGVCTSLGLGTRQLNSGFNQFNSDIDADDINIQVGNVQKVINMYFEISRYDVNDLYVHLTDCNNLGNYCHCNCINSVWSWHGHPKII